MTRVSDIPAGRHFRTPLTGRNGIREPILHNGGVLQGVPVSLDGRTPGTLERKILHPDVIVETGCSECGRLD